MAGGATQPADQPRREDMDTWKEERQSKSVISHLFLDNSLEALYLCLENEDLMLLFHDDY